MSKKQVPFVGKKVSRRTFLKAGVTAATGVALSPLIKISPARAAGEVRIGVVSGITGYAGPWTRGYLQAEQIITDELNAAGGFKSMGGAKIRLFVSDSKSDLKIQASEAEKMVNVNNIKLFMGGGASGSRVDLQRRL